MIEASSTPERWRGGRPGVKPRGVGYLTNGLSGGNLTHGRTRTTLGAADQWPGQAMNVQ